MSDWLQFVDRKIGTALMLDEGQCNGSYSDACVLLSALLSGIAAELWPGNDRIDGRRFAELWFRFCPKELQPIQLSVPLLRRSFLKSGQQQEAKLLEERRPDMFNLGHGSLVLRGEEVDLPEAEVLKLPLTITQKDLRRYSYPAVFYKHVRSSLVHEFKLSDDAASHRATRMQANVSYVNRGEADAHELRRRLIHFHIEWLEKLTRAIAANVAELFDNYERLPRPTSWWLDG